MSTEAFEDFYFDVCTLDYAWLAQGPRAAGRADGRRARGPHHGPGDRPALLDRRHPGRPVRRGDEHPRRRGLHRPGARLGRGPHPVQHADDLPGRLVRRRPARVPEGPDRRGRLHRGRRRRSSAGSSSRTKGPATSANGRSAAIPRVLHPMRDILFDEKIAGSFHLTPGNAYDEADNGNRSKIHWDLVQIQRPDYGGGTIALRRRADPRRRDVRARGSPGPQSRHEIMIPLIFARLRGRDELRKGMELATDEHR